MTNYTFGPVEDDGRLYASAWAGMALGVVAFIAFMFLWLVQNRPGQKRAVALAFAIAGIIIAIQQLSFAFDAGTLVRVYKNDSYELDWGRQASRIAAFVAVYVGLGTFLNMTNRTIFFGAFLVAIINTALLVCVLSLSNLAWALFILTAIIGAFLVMYTFLMSRLQSEHGGMFSFYGGAVFAYAFIGMTLFLVNVALGHGIFRVWGGHPSNIVVESWVNVTFEILFVYVLGLLCVGLYETDDHSKYTVRDRISEDDRIMDLQLNAHRRRKYLFIKDVREEHLPPDFSDTTLRADSHVVYKQHSGLNHGEFIQQGRVVFSDRRRRSRHPAGLV